MKSYFKTLLISLYCITVSLPFAAQTTVAQTTTPKPENVSPSADLSRDGKILVTSSGGKLQVWNLATGESKTFSLLDGKYATITSIAISPDLQTVVTKSSGLDLKFENNTPVGCSSNSDSGNFGFSCNLGSRSSRSIRSSSGYAIQVWNLSTGKQSGILEYLEPSDFRFGFGFGALANNTGEFLKFSADGNLLVTSNANQIKFWNAKTGKIIYKKDLNRSAVGMGTICGQCLAINPVDITKFFHAVDLTTHKIDSENKPISLSFPKENSADDGRDNSFKRISALTQNSSTAFSPDGKLIAVSALYDLHVWRSETGDRLHRLPAQLQLPNLINTSFSYTYLVFSPNSKVLASANNEGTIQLWNLENGKEIGRSIAYSTRGNIFLGFDFDGKTLISVDRRGKIQLWETSLTPINLSRNLVNKDPTITLPKVSSNELNTTEANTYNNSIFLKFLSKDIPGSLADYNRAIELNPRLALAYKRRGNLKENNLNDRSGALADYSKAIELNPKEATVYNNRGFLRYISNDISGALAEYNKAIDLDLKNADAYNNRGFLKAYNLKDISGALADYNKAIELNPNLASAYNNRGNLKENNLKDISGALADYDKAIELNPKLAVAYKNRGNLKENNPKYISEVDDEVNDYRKAIELMEPQDDRTYRLRADLKQHIKDTAGALADYNKAISLNSQDATAYYHRADLKQRLQDTSGALADHNKAIELNPKFANAYKSRADLKFFNFNDIQGALADYNKAIGLNSKFADAYKNRADLKFFKLDDSAGALDDYNKAIALNPQYTEAQNNLSNLKQYLSGKK
jgi:tetratricopeptide (TPR) repeat protein